MMRPTPEQIRAAAAIIKQFATQTKGTASPTQTENAAHSVASVLGFVGTPAAQYMDAVNAAMDEPANTVVMLEPFDDTAEEGGVAGFYVRAENPLGLKIGKTFIDADTLPDDEADGMTADDVAELQTMTKDALRGLAKTAGMNLSKKMSHDDMVAAIVERHGGMVSDDTVKVNEAGVDAAPDGE